MTTAQEPLNGHCVLPPPLPVEIPSQANSSGLPTDKPNSNSEPLKSRISDLQSPDAPPAFAASAYHVPPKRYAPKANSYQYDDFASLEMDTQKLPDCCQFLFSDGRQCTMARSEIHPSLCPYHATREEQLFGAPGGKVVGESLDLPELYSACGDLATAAGVNRALAQVFRLLAQRRISRQEAATFGHLAQLLLRSISAARAESAIPPGSSPPRPPAEVTNGVSFRRSTKSSRATSPGEEPVSQSPLPQESLPHGISSPLAAARPSAVAPAPQADSSPDGTNGPAVSTAHPTASKVSSPAPEIPAVPCELPTAQAAPLPATTEAPHTAPNPGAPNSRKISTYENARLKLVQNEHLQEKR